MKLIKFFPIFVLIVLASCSKSDESVILEKDSSTPTYKGPGGDLCTLVEITHPVGEPGRWDCLKPSSNCFCQAVIITPGTKSSNNEESYQEFIGAIQEDSIDDFFNGAIWIDLFPNLAEPYSESFLSMLQEDRVRLVEYYNDQQDKYLYIAFEKDYDGDIIPSLSLFTLQVKLNY